MLFRSTYLKNLFSYIISDLSGITFNQVQFEWGLLSTDLNHEVKALNSPITFTVIDSTFEDINAQAIGLDYKNEPLRYEFINKMLGAQ